MNLRRFTFAALVAAALAAATGCARSTPKDSAPAVRVLGTPGAPTTSREDLDRVVAEARRALAAKPGDSATAVRLSDALLRQTRVSGNAGLAAEAAAALHQVLVADPGNYEALRMLTAVDLSEHRFRDALRDAERCRVIRSNDAWLYGAMGDAHIELGEYPEAFDAFDRMVALKPNAASYARASYARELQGDLAGALRFMTMATEATGPQDPESGAWHHAQLGHLHLVMGHLTDAEREFAHAEYIFPGHPFASEGMARVKQARGDFAGALAIVQARSAASPTPSDFALAGDLLAALGHSDAAERQYRLAEAAWQSDVPDPARYVRFLVEHRRRMTEIVGLAERAAADRHDIFTCDALAWAYFLTGDTARAAVAMKDALRTGSRDPIIRGHAKTIASATAADATGPR